VRRLAVVGLLEEEVAAVVAVLAPRFSPPILTFSRAVSGLRWSSRKLTRALRADARESLRESEASLPSLCADYRAWAASGYKVIPSDTKRYARERAPRWTDSELGHINQGLWDKLARYETPATRRLARDTQKLEEQWAVVVAALALGASRELHHDLR
jgi:hypothetical protein